MKVFSLAMLMIGSIIGAGFASGREIVAFFGTEISWWISIVCGLGIFAISLVLLSIGIKVKKDSFGEVNQQILGRFSPFADVFLLLNGFIVLSGMLAGMDSLFHPIFSFAPAYSVVSGIVCVFIVTKGVQGIINGSGIIVPLIIIALIAVCAFNFSTSYMTKTAQDLPAAVVYVSMNMMLASTVFTTVNKYSYKQIVGASALTGGVIAVLMLLIISALNKTQTYPYPMPIVEIAKNTSPALYVFSIIAVAIGIFTTMMTAMSGLTEFFVPFVGSRAYSAVFVLLLSLMVSNLGFETVIAYLYPIIGVVGLFYIAICFVYLTRNRYRKLSKTANSFFDNRHHDIHKSGKQTKNQSRSHNQV